MYVLLDRPSYAAAVVVSLHVLGKSMHAMKQLMRCWPLYSRRNYCFAASVATLVSLYLYCESISLTIVACMHGYCITSSNDVYAIPNINIYTAT